MRAQEHGQMALSVQGLSFVLLRSVGVNDTQLLQLLQPFQGQYPNNDAQFRALQQGLRRMGHILEHRPGNIAQMLGRGATTSRAFWFDSSPPQQTDARAEDPWAGGNDPWSRAGADNNTATYWQRDDSGSSAGPWYSNVFWADGEDENGTDSDTASSDGNTAYPIPDGCSTAGEIAQKLFWNYQRAKSACRQWTGKPVRAVRRFIRGKAASKGQHKGKGVGKALVPSLPRSVMMSAKFSSANPKAKARASRARTAKVVKASELLAKVLAGSETPSGLTAHRWRAMHVAASATLLTSAPTIIRTYTRRLTLSMLAALRDPWLAGWIKMSYKLQPC